MNTQHRTLLVLSGQRSDCIARCEAILQGRKAVLVSRTSRHNIPFIHYKQVATQLGQEHTEVIFDATDHFDANALGVISGTIVGGGRLILLLPTLPCSNYPHAHFLTRLLTLLAQHNVPLLSCSHADLTFSPFKHTATPNAPSLPTRADASPEIMLSVEQQQVVDVIIRVAKGHRNRPLVLTADRGRGKSTALGFAAKALLQLGLKQIIICAPAQATVQPLLQLVTNEAGVHYLSPDELVRQQPAADIVMIDEAGAIPVPLLGRLLRHYSRMVFSTTLQGYEGNGKGFAIRFQHQLDSITPQWRALTLTSPTRWGVGDPLEQLFNDMLLLDAEPATITGLQGTKPHLLEHRVISGKELINDESLLRQLFGLLVIAHYQTRPSDLLHLLDSPNINTHVLLKADQVIATTIVSHEGNLPHTLSEDIYQGRRRPKGHLVPQILTFQLGVAEAATLKTDRIMRIAVHPHCQRHHVGQHLLRLIQQQSTADYLSSSFGLSTSLLKFWRQSDYHIAHLGLRREASSGYHSAVMLHPLTPEGDALLVDCQTAFRRHFLAQLADALSSLEPDVVVALLASVPCDPDFTLSLQEQRDIERFADGVCGYDLAMSALLRWLPSALAGGHSRIDKRGAILLVMRVLQHRDWTYCCKVLGLSGKQHALKTMQHAVAVLWSPSSAISPPEKH